MSARTTQREPEELPDTRMTFGEHLDELRTCLIRAIYGVVAGFIACLLVGGDIFGFLSRPLLVALQAEGVQPSLYVSSLPEGFITYIKVCLIGGIIISSPWVFYQLWKFVGAGLYPHERRYVHIFMPFSAGLFLAGAMFFLLVVAPLSCSFFIRFSTHFKMPSLHPSFIYKALQSRANDAEKTPEPNALSESAVPAGQSPKDQAESKPLINPLFTLQKYVSLIMILSLAFGLAFQMPLVVFFLGRVGIVDLSTFRSCRKYVIFGIVIGAAILTPPDVVSQIALAMPMYVLYELGIIMVWLWPRPKV